MVMLKLIINAIVTKLHKQRSHNRGGNKYVYIYLGPLMRIISITSLLLNCITVSESPGQQICLSTEQFHVLFAKIKLIYCYITVIVKNLGALTKLVLKQTFWRLTLRTTDKNKQRCLPGPLLSQPQIMVPMLRPIPLYWQTMLASSLEAAATEMRSLLRSSQMRHCLARRRSQKLQSAAPPAMVPSRYGLISITFFTV